MHPTGPKVTLADRGSVSRVHVRAASRPHTRRRASNLHVWLRSIASSNVRGGQFDSRTTRRRGRLPPTTGRPVPGCWSRPGPCRPPGTVQSCDASALTAGETRPALFLTVTPLGGLHCAPASMPGSGLARARPLLCFRTFLAGASPPWFEHVPAGQAVESTHQSPAVSVVPLLRDRRLAGHARGVSARP